MKTYILLYPFESGIAKKKISHMDEQLKMTHCFQHRFIHYKWRGRNDVGHLADLFVQ